MLPADLLSYTASGDVLTPAYLCARDEVWIRVALDEVSALEGKRGHEADAAWAFRIPRRLARAGASRRAALGVRHVLERVWRRATVSAVPPVLARRAAFGEMARAPGDRATALARAALVLEVTTEALVDALFADRDCEKRVVLASTAPSANEVRALYNLALLQGLLLRADGIRLTVREHVRSVVRFAKLKRLLCTCELVSSVDRDARDVLHGTRINVSGPLSILRQTTKYGLALASFIPALFSTPGWSLEARVHLAGRAQRVFARPEDPIARSHALPRDADSDIERRLVRDVRRLGSEWSIARETAAIRAGARLFFPDFTLTRGSARVLVEIVGFYTAEYLEKKLGAIRAAGVGALIVCVDESLGPLPTLTAGQGRVLAFRRRVDARALLAMADAIVAHSSRPLGHEQLRRLEIAPHDLDARHGR